MSNMYTVKVLVLSYFCWLATGSRPNTVAYALEIKAAKDQGYDLRSALVRSLAAGAKEAAERCSEQFKWEKWNCPQSSFSRRLLEPLTREMAYVTSVSAAGILYAVTRSCSRGVLSPCGCSKDPLGPSQNEWEWQGCSDDVTMGNFVAERFLSSLESGDADVVARANLHNSKLGRMLAKEMVRVVCKCHGLSGSCTTKTCWRKIAPLSEIAAGLKHKYHRAQRIEVNSVVSRVTLGIPDSEMVFLDDSPDYCKRNVTTNWPGTGGRLCSRNSVNTTDKAEKRSCRELCRSCGHQVAKRPIKVTFRCNCTFHWCCQVKCNTCHKTDVQHFCDDKPKRM